MRGGERKITPTPPSPPPTLGLKTEMMQKHVSPNIKDKCDVPVNEGMQQNRFIEKLSRKDVCLN